jgi:CRISPR-associated protein Csd1
MFVQALAQFADRELTDQLQDESREEKSVPYEIELDDAGTFLNVTTRLTSVARGKKTIEVGLPLLVPRSPVARNSPTLSYPLLAVDDIMYVLGPGSWTKTNDEEKHQRRHQAFVDLIAKAAQETGDPALLACRSFYTQPDEVEKARQALSQVKSGTSVCLSVNGPVVGRPAVQNYWREHYASAKAASGSAGMGECLISGRYGAIARTHEKIKGASNLGGQASGVALMSFDKDAFRSYGWDQNANSPVAPDRAMAYVLALNNMLRPDSEHRRDIAGVGFIFWTKEHTEFDLWANIESPDESQVKALLELDPLANPDPNMFYMAGLGANGGRLLIRYWVAETLEKVKANQKGWFEGLRVASLSGGLSPFPKFWQLRFAIHREGEPSKNRVLSLIRRAIEGPAQPLGFDMLGAALSRLRVPRDNRSDLEKSSDLARMGLIRLCINDLTSYQGETMSAQLDPGSKHPAYLCGRLLAVYESLQYQAQGDLNQTVTDRYFALAATYPALAFPKLEDLGQKHLRKLRREAPGSAVNISKDIDQLHLDLEQASGFRFPASLDLIDQGRFALGYHHQRAHQFEQARNRKNQENQQS